MTNEKNLIPAKKGEKGRNPKGITGIKFATLYKQALAQKILIKDNITGRKIPKVIAKAIVAQRIADALDENNSAAERTKAGATIEDRVDGKPEQPITAKFPTHFSLLIGQEETDL